MVHIERLDPEEMARDVVDGIEAVGRIRRHVSFGQGTLSIQRPDGTYAPLSEIKDAVLTTSSWADLERAEVIADMRHAMSTVGNVTLEASGMMVDRETHDLLLYGPKPRHRPVGTIDPRRAPTIARWLGDQATRKALLRGL